MLQRIGGKGAVVGGSPSRTSTGRVLQLPPDVHVLVAFTVSAGD